MKTQSLCQHHKKQIVKSEKTAFSYWKTMMHNGLQAYSDCRSKDAEKYFNAAFEIAILRFSCKEKNIFRSTHIIKPVEFLITITTERHDFEQALLLLSKLSSLSDSENIRKERALWIFLSEQYQQITDVKNINNFNIPPQLMPYHEQNKAIH